MAQLRTDYKDQILDTSVNTQRKYSQVDNGDGTISLVDETTYSQKGDTFGAGDINSTNAVVNTCLQVVHWNPETAHLETKTPDYEG